jgi:hypothetical protein
LNPKLQAAWVKVLTWMWRGAQLMGPWGWAGVALWLAALLACAAAFVQQQRTSGIVVPASLFAASETDPNASSATRPTPLQLPQEADVPQVIKSMQEESRKAGLVWPQAEYRVLDGSPEQLPQLEVQTVIKGSYPQVKLWVEALLRAHPALGLRTWTMERPNADTGVADAKLVWVLYLRGQGVTP